MQWRLSPIFANSTGILAPEAAEGFAAIGMPKCAKLLHQAMNFFGTPYPRDRAVRNKMIPTGPGKRRNEWDPFKEFDDPFYDALDVENGGFSVAADEYASKLS